MPNEINKCASYKPGHNVHWIQAREKSHLPRLWAKVDLIGPRAVRVVTDRQDRVLFHHEAVELYLYTLIAKDGEVKYAPDSKLLYVRIERDDEIDDLWLLAYLSEGELSPCFGLDGARSYSADEVFRSE